MIVQGVLDPHGGHVLKRFEPPSLGYFCLSTSALCPPRIRSHGLQSDTWRVEYNPFFSTKKKNLSACVCFFNYFFFFYCTFIKNNAYPFGVWTHNFCSIGVFSIGYLKYLNLGFLPCYIICWLIMPWKSPSVGAIQARNCLAVSHASLSKHAMLGTRFKELFFILLVFGCASSRA